jgi:hypothetical protein
MRTLNGWPLILLAPLFGVALLPTAVMTGLELAGIHWWGPRSNVGLGFIGYFLLELALPKGVSNAATNFGYIQIGTARGEGTGSCLYRDLYGRRALSAEPTLLLCDRRSLPLEQFNRVLGRGDHRRCFHRYVSAAIRDDAGLGFSIGLCPGA